MEILILITVTFGLLALIYYTEQSNNINKKILAILQDLQEVTNLDIPRETKASLIDVGKRTDNIEGLDNITRTDSLWEEDGLEGEEIEDIYAR